MITLNGDDGSIVPESATAGERAPAAMQHAEARAREAFSETRLPPRSRWENLTAALTAMFAAGWGVALLALLQSAESRLAPILRAVDRLLLPAVKTLGRPGVVALIGFFFAALFAALQRYATDNVRLREAVRRCRAVHREAKASQGGALDSHVYDDMLASVRHRTWTAALFGPALFLGPLVLLMMWMALRMNPATWNPPPGTRVTVEAWVDGEYTNSVILDYDRALTLDVVSPASQSLPPVRPALEAVLNGSTNLTDELKAQITNTFGENWADSLQSWLSNSVPPKVLSWVLSTRNSGAGRFKVEVGAAGFPPVAARLALGGWEWPEPLLRAAKGGGATQTVAPRDPKHPIRSLKVIYPDPGKNLPVFLAPLKNAGLPWDAGWLLTLVAVYVATVLALRPVLKTA